MGADLEIVPGPVQWLEEESGRESARRRERLRLAREAVARRHVAQAEREGRDWHVR